jgi:spore coat protein H
MCKYIFLSLLLLISCKKEIVIFDGLPDVNLELPLILKLNGKNCFYDASSETLKYSVEESSLVNFSPFVEFQDYSRIYFEGQELTNNQMNAFGTVELNRPYPIQIKTEGQTKNLSLLFTSIPMVQVVTFDKIENEHSTLAKMTLNYPQANKISEVDWIEIEIRGASSLQNAKKSYGLTIYKDKNLSNRKSQSYFNLNPNSKWIMDALFVDRSRLRNKVSFELWASMGDASGHIGIKSNFVEVFVNNESKGLFCFNEKYTEEFLSLNEESVFYKGNDNSPVTFFDELPDGNPNSATWNEWEQIHPNPNDEIEWDDFKNLCDLIVNGDDVEFKNTIGNRVDLDNVIDYYLFVSLCGAVDNVGKNVFFLKRNASEKFILVPWDMDATWGRAPYGNLFHHSGEVTNGFFNRLVALDPENFNTRLKLRWQELRSGQFSGGNLLAVFSSNFDELDDYGIIPYENEIWQNDLVPELEQDFIETWIQNRLIYLDGIYQ